MFLIVIKQQLFELLEECTDCQTDVFVHFYSPQRLSLNNISLSLCGIGFCIHSKREGRHMAARSTKHVIFQNRDGP